MCPCVHTPAHAPDLTPTIVLHYSPLLASSPLTHQLACAFTPLAKSHHSHPLPFAPTTLADIHAPCCQSTILTPYDLPSQLRPTTSTCSIKILFNFSQQKKKQNDSHLQKQKFTKEGEGGMSRLPKKKKTFTAMLT